MEILSKNTIEQYILPNLSIGLRGTECETDFLLEVVSAILYRLKTGSVGCPMSMATIACKAVFY